jgi:hypothetical protein
MANCQYLDADGSFTVDPATKLAMFVAAGGGGGGGSGRKGATSTNRAGGGGGGGGGLGFLALASKALPSSIAVTIGQGGGGAAAQTTADTNGNAGTAGTSTTIEKVMIVGGGGAGPGGATSAVGGPAGGTVDTQFGVGANGGDARTTGDKNGLSPGATAYGCLVKPGGGGGGGYMTNANSPTAGGIGSQWTFLPGHVGAAAGTSGASPTHGVDAALPDNPYGGGGGGGSSVTTNAARGGHGLASRGGGGGGGGAVLNTAGNSGPGGDGADGYAVMIPVESLVDTQSFAANGTWTKPGGLTAHSQVMVILWGGGGAGAAGKKNVVGGSFRGGGAGGGGGMSLGIFPAADLPSTVSVTVGVAQAGGTSFTADTTSGPNLGKQSGNDSFFGNFIAAEGGTGGNGTTNATVAAGNGSFLSGITGTAPQLTGINAIDGEDFRVMSGSGGNGCGINSGVAGSGGGASRYATIENMGFWARSPPPSGSSVGDASDAAQGGPWWSGGSGGGASSFVGGRGGDGAAGLGPGAPGGGGGNTVNDGGTSRCGAGGAGARGHVYVLTFK